jgi:pimeloyl-ACP methyl ester carboxylesterase
MGGTICLDYFTTYSPAIEGIVLLGPGGLLRKLPSEYKSTWFQYPNLVSKAYMRRLLSTTLGVDSQIQPVKEVDKLGGFTPQSALQFQFDHHLGHVESFLSNIQYGPIQHQEEIWKRACDIISAKKGCCDEDDKKSPMYDGKILVVCGNDDWVIPAADTKEDMEQYLGDQKHFDFRVVPGGHGFPWAEGKTVAKYIIDFWSL